MKQHIYLLLMFLAAALAGGCDNTLGNDEEEGDGTVSVTLTTAGAISKAGMDGSMNITWNRNDEVLVNGERYRVSPDGDNPSTVTISGVYESDGYLAVFPYSNQYTAEDSYLVYVPDRQAYSTDMPLETYPMIAYSTSTDLQMNGVCGVVRIGLTGSGNLVRATVSGNAPGDILAGTLAVPAADVTGGSMKDSYSEFYTEYQTSGSVEITVDRGLEINETAKYIYAAVPAREYASGFTIEFEDSDRNRTTVTVDGSVRVPRAKVTDLGTFTLEQGGDEPPVQENPVSLEISQEYAGPRPYAEISYRISTQNAVRIDCAVVGMATYENESSDGASDEEIVMKYSDYPLGESHVEEANNGGYLWTDMFLEPDTDYVFLAAATGEDNKAAVRSEIFTTEDYLPEASAESSWNTVSTDGFMECNLFSEILGQGGYPAASEQFSGLTVQQLGNQDVFRIINPFQDFWSSLGRETASGDRYIMIDARDADAVRIEWWKSRQANYIGTMLEGNEMYIQSSLYTGAMDGREELGTYDRENSIIDFGNVTVLSDGYMFSNPAGSTTLWFRNPNPEVPDDPDSPGISTEDFEIVEGEW